MKVLIDIKEYRDLKEESLMLQCLENAGVDNWDGYSYANEDYYESLEALDLEIQERLDETPSNT